MLKRRRFGSESELEARLRSHRAEARPEFVDEVTASVSARPLGRRASSRLAFASAVAVFILGTFASFGGIGYAASGASGAYHAVKVSSGKLSVSVHKSSATDMYSKPKTQPVTPHETQAGVAGAQALRSNVKSNGSLPFTGLSLGSTLLLSLLLIAGGIFLRRRERGQG